MSRWLFVYLSFISFFSLLLPAQARLAPNALAPNFEFFDVAGKALHLQALRGRYVVLEWTNASCPFVKKHYSGGAMQATQKKLRLAGAYWIQIVSSAPGKQGFLTPIEFAIQQSSPNPLIDSFLSDASGTVGKLYGAESTPQVFLIDPEGRIVYQGAIDNIASTHVSDVARAKNYLLLAFEQSRSGQIVEPAATSPYGCSVKYAYP